MGRCISVGEGIATSKWRTSWFTGSSNPYPKDSLMKICIFSGLYRTRTRVTCTPNLPAPFEVTATWLANQHYFQAIRTLSNFTYRTMSPRFGTLAGATTRIPPSSSERIAPRSFCRHNHDFSLAHHDRTSDTIYILSSLPIF